MGNFEVGEEMIKDTTEWGNAKKFPRLLTLEISCESGKESNNTKALLVDLLKEYDYDKKSYKFKVAKVKTNKQGKKMVYKINKGKGL